MSDPSNLLDLYIEELQDLWSANDQMAKVVRDMAGTLDDPELVGKFERSVEGIDLHTEMLRSLLEDVSSETRKEHCRGMEGLVKEARKHVVDADVSGAVREVAAIAQYQRMCHYGIAGFGTAKAFADALGRSEHAIQLDEALEDIYESDDYMSEIAERSKNIQAA